MRQSPGSEKTWTSDEERPSCQFADGGWDDLALRMRNELRTGQLPSVQVFELSPSRCIDEAKEWKEAGTHFKNEPKNPSHAREHDMGMQSTLFVFRSEIL